MPFMLRWKRQITIASAEILIEIVMLAHQLGLISLKFPLFFNLD